MNGLKTRYNKLIQSDWFKQNSPALFASVVTLLFFIFNLYLLSKHESWLDEAQAWLIARDANIPEMFRQIRFEGHPMLWFLFLMPFAKLSFPYEYIGLISLSVVSIAVFLVVRYFPFGKAVNSIVVFSAIFIYYYPVIARNYSVVLLFAVVAAIFYKDRAKKPLRYAIAISLLAQTHVLIFGFCVALSLIFIIELLKNKTINHKKSIFLISLFAPILSLVSVVLQLFGSNQTNVTVAQFSAFGNISINEIYLSAITYFKHILLRYFGLELDLFFSVMLLSAVVGAVVLIAVFYPKQALMLTFGIGFVFAVHILIYQSFMMQKIIIAVIVLLFCLVSAWHETAIRYKVLPKINAKYKHRVLELIVVALSLLSLSSLSEDIEQEISHKYARSDDIASFVVQTLPQDSVIVCPTVGDGTAIAPYLTTQKLWSPSSEKFFTYLTWDSSLNVRLTPTELSQKIDLHLSEYDNVYILFQPHGVVPTLEGYPKTLSEVAVFSEHTIQGEPEITLYKVG